METTYYSSGSAINFKTLIFEPAETDVSVQPDGSIVKMSFTIKNSFQGAILTATWGDGRLYNRTGNIYTNAAPLLGRLNKSINISDGVIVKVHYGS